MKDISAEERLILNGAKAHGMRGMEWINLAQGRVKRRALDNAVINFLVAQNVRKFLNSFLPASFSRRTVLNGIV